MRFSARLTELLGRAVSLPASYRPESLRVLAGATCFGSNEKAARELGFSARPLVEGLTQTIEHELRMLQIKKMNKSLLISSTPV